MIHKPRPLHAPQSALTNTAHRLRGVVTRGVEQARDAGAASGATARELIAGIEGPILPLAETWSTGVGQILSGHPELPHVLRGVVVKLDHFGHLEVSPDAIGIDGRATSWKSVDEIRFGSAVNLVTARALELEIERLTDRMPAMPGSKWLVRHSIELLAGLCLASAERKLTGAPDAAADGIPVGVPVTIICRGRIRRTELTPGIFATLIAATVPDVPRAIALTARQHNVKLTVTDPSRSLSHAAALRKIADTLTERIRRPVESATTDSGTDPHAHTAGGAIAAPAETSTTEEI